MPQGYEEMRVPSDVEKKLHNAAQEKAARIWNDRHPDNPVH